MRDVVVVGERWPKELSEGRTQVEIVVPSSALFSINADWCVVQIPAIDVLRGMHIQGHDGDVIYVVQVFVRDNLDYVTPTA